MPAIPREVAVCAVIALGGFVLYLISFDRSRGIPRARPPEYKRVLVTGAAGFIGHGVSKELVKNPLNKVVGIDNFNDYYDVQLKIDRGYDLYKLGVEMHNADICNHALLEELFEKHHFTHVIHLAAQAGVRHSLKKPLAYIHSNVECQLTLMDLLAKKPGIKLIYASSSSVYGKQSPVPFKISAPTDKPGNMYAATKVTDELLSLHYCMNFNLTSVGLRFFTVYGPYGRPDMAVYKFAEAIDTGKELPLFQQSEDEPLGRDFTYVDDIVDGVVNSMDYEPQECGSRFNLGFGNPVNVPKLISLLEKELQTKANVRILPIPPSEILRTWADISKSTERINFKPKINLEEGVRRFVAWYKDYQRQRMINEKSQKETLAQIWFNSLLEERIERNEGYAAEKKHHSTKKSSNRHEVSGIKFQFHQGLDSKGETILSLPELKANVEALRRRCQDLPGCVGFNTNGELKGSIILTDTPLLSHTKEGIYVADINVCETNLHDCDKNSRCVNIVPGQYKCKCMKSYVKTGKGCVLQYGKLSLGELHEKFAQDFFNVFNVTEMKGNKTLHYFQGYDSPGGDYMVVKEKEVSKPQLMKLCQNDPLCVAINTNGIMKRKMGPKSAWVKSTKNNSGGIYVFDMDYCLRGDIICPGDALCTRLGPAQYDCQCRDGYVMKNKVCYMKPLLATGGVSSEQSLASKIVSRTT